MGDRFLSLAAPLCSTCTIYMQLSEESITPANQQSGSIFFNNCPIFLSSGRPQQFNNTVQEIGSTRQGSLKSPGVVCLTPPSPKIWSPVSPILRINYLNIEMLSNCWIEAIPHTASPTSSQEVDLAPMWSFSERSWLIFSEPIVLCDWWRREGEDKLINWSNWKKQLDVTEVSHSSVGFNVAKFLPDSLI